eukprot:TRINITY_DN6416_c0_g3_i4.p1 TRINITY_DN6416_c0_g3~~TRINITY_DN6416_c0_g3_i4.p1  ORF type:complete len:316 (-),score=23.72 TRINITY_DN6416_c0_g3_i4:445-1392(-)
MMYIVKQNTFFLQSSRCVFFNQNNTGILAKGQLQRQRLGISSMSGREQTMEINTSLNLSKAMKVFRIPALSDNYIWLLVEPKSQKVAIVDPGESSPVVDALSKMSLGLDYIFNTHHHWDHTGGNIDLKRKYNATIVGPKADEARIPGIDIALQEGEIWNFGELEMKVFDTPGHTRGHITLWFPAAKAVFPGDTLFAIGCGKVFEGTFEQMWNSLSKIRSLPPDTQVYCAHEYTQSNARFAVTADPSNQDLLKRKEVVDQARQKGLATVPSLLEEELKTNPFLRPDSDGVRNAMRKGKDVPDVNVFAAVRSAKDKF